MITIDESNMRFGPYNKDDVLYIEKSNLYTTMKNAPKITEFILKKNSCLLILEAKTSSPKPIKEHKTMEYPNGYIEKISEKFLNTLNMFISANIGILADEQNEAESFLPVNEMRDFKFKYALVIKECDKEWLPNIKLALEEQLRVQMKIWNVEIRVLNEDLAKKLKLVS